MTISSFDHVAIPISDENDMVEFYNAIGLEISKLSEHIYAVQFGENKIHFHLPELWKDSQFDLRGPTSLPGCGDLCFVWSGTLDSLLETLEDNKISVIAGPMKNQGGKNQGTEIGKSIYVRDPDKNLLEFIVYD